MGDPNSPSVGWEQPRASKPLAAPTRRRRGRLPTGNTNPKHQSRYNWNKANSEKVREINRKSYAKNKAKRNKKQREYREKNRQKIRDNASQWSCEKRRTDPQFVAVTRLRDRITSFVRRKRCKKQGKTADLIGCDYDAMVAHLECNERGLTIPENEIDHIFPLTRYKIKDADQQFKAMNFTNMQLLTTKENLDKRNKLPTKAMAAKVERWAWPPGVTEDMLPDKYDGWETPLRINFDCIFAYLTCTNYDFRYDIQKGLRPRRSIRTAMAHEINMYAIVQKEQLGLDKAVEEVKFRMSRYSVTPNMMIVPPQLGLYMALAPEQKLTFPLGGPAAQAAFEAGLAGFESKAFRGLGIMTSTPYEVSDDQDSVQMLQRSSQVGEFYRMSPPAAWDTTKKLPASYMDIMIYDEESDRHVHITFEQAMYATGYGKAGGPIGDIFGIKNISAEALGKIVNPANGGADAASRAIFTTFAADDACKDAKDNPTQDAARLKFVEEVIALVKAGVWVPIEIVIARPFIEHLMLSAIVAVAGRETGATLFGPADMQISANTSVKTIEGHYTCHTKSVITKPQNVYVMRDVMCNGYVAGGNTRFFGEPPRGFTGPADAADVTDDMDKRLSFHDDASGEYSSMLAFGAPWGEGAKRDQVISITDRLLPWEITSPNTKNTKDYFPGGDANYQSYRAAYNLNSIHFGEDVRAAENMEFISQGSMNNGLCFIGPHRKYNPFSDQFHQLIPGQGHFGPDAIPGDARWRRGEAVSLKAARDSMVSLEVAAHAQMFSRRKA